MGETEGVFLQTPVFAPRPRTAPRCTPEGIVHVARGTCFACTGGCSGGPHAGRPCTAPGLSTSVANDATVMLWNRAATGERERVVEIQIVVVRTWL